MKFVEWYKEEQFKVIDSPEDERLLQRGALLLITWRINCIERTRGTKLFSFCIMLHKVNTDR